jgi:hypothetical protein
MAAYAPNNIYKLSLARDSGNSILKIATEESKSCHNSNYFSSSFEVSITDGDLDS